MRREREEPMRNGKQGTQRRDEVQERNGKKIADKEGKRK